MAKRIKSICLILIATLMVNTAVGQKWNLQISRGLTFSHAVVSKANFYGGDFSLHKGDLGLGVDVQRVVSKDVFVGIGIRSFTTNSIIKRFDADDGSHTKELYYNQRFVTAKFSVGKRFQVQNFIISPEVSWQPAFNFAPTISKSFFNGQRKWGKGFASRGEIACSINRKIVNNISIGILPAYNFTFENLYIKNPDTIGINSLQMSLLIAFGL